MIIPFTPHSHFNTGKQLIQSNLLVNLSLCCRSIRIDNITNVII